MLQASISKINVYNFSSQSFHIDCANLPVKSKLYETNFWVAFQQSFFEQHNRHFYVILFEYCEYLNIFLFEYGINYLILVQCIYT